MPKFEEQNINPVESPREAYDKTEEDEASLKAQLGGAKSADEIMEIATKLKTIEGTKKDVIDTAHEEANKEEAERNMYDEAKAEDVERTMYDEAKAEDTARTHAKETAKELDLELENLKNQIAGKSPDEILAIAAKMKEIETKKIEIKASEEWAITEKDQKQYNKILAEIKGGKKSEEKIEDNPSFQQLKLAYGEMNGPGSHNPEVQKRWAELSSEIAANLNNTSDIKEAHFYLTNKDRNIIDKKWDELSHQEVENATSEEEMKRAIQNIRPGGYTEPMKIREAAIEKFPSLRGPRGY